MNKPEISVVVPCLNAERWIQETLRSVERQNIPGLEVIVVDDASTDRSAEIIRKEFPAVRLVQSSRGGAAKARTKGFSLAEGRFIQVLDADDLLALGKIELQRKALEETGADIAYGDWRKLAVSPGGTYRDGPLVSRRMTNPEIDIFLGFWCPPAAYLFRREVIEKIGPWREDFRCTDDARFMVECALQGFRFVYCEGIMAYYRVHQAGSVSTSDSRGFLRECLATAVETHEWWQKRGGLNEQRTNALLKAYDHVCRASFGVDEQAFRPAFQALQSLKPDYVPEESPRLAAASRLVGYERALKISYFWKRAFRCR